MKGIAQQNELVFANEDGKVDLSEIAVGFTDKCAALIKERLPGSIRRFSLMPYRRSFGQEFIGFDWEDETGGRLGFTINYGESTEVYLPEPVWPHQNCIAVKDATDALLLCRLIAEKVNGNSLGEI